MPSFYLPLYGDLTDQPQQPRVAFGEGTVNFYQDDEGYLCNYAGRTDKFRRLDSYPASLGVPPDLEKNVKDITRLAVFRDVQGREHIVFVRGAEVCEKVGNGYRVLYTLGGVFYDQGRFFPDLVVHEAKLLIVNFGDPVLMWDGVQGVHPLGVQEVPLPPEPWKGEVPWTVDHSSPGGGIGRAYGPFNYKTFWWVGSAPANGPGDNLGADDETRVPGLYQMVVQFFDEYGNHGAVSPPCRIVEIRPVFTAGPSTASDSEIYTDLDLTYLSPTYLMIDWYPPLTETHIWGVRVGRTLSLNMDGGAGAPGVFFTNIVVENTTQGRATLRMTDGHLAEQKLIDMTVRGPTQARGGCSWNRRVILWGHEDPFRVTWSDQELFGQFRPENEFHAHDHVRVVAPLGDRAVVISRSSTEVLYDNAGSMALLEQDFANGSRYGRSIIDVGGALFGLWNRGFGFYDGSKFDFVEAPFFLKDVYMDNRFFVYSARQWGDEYVVSVRKDSVTTGNNYLLVYHLKRRQWHLLQEEVFDIAEQDGGLLGCDDSIYELFKGSFTNAATLKIQGLIPEGGSPMTQRSLVETRLLMEASSAAAYTMLVEGEFTMVPASGGLATSLPSMNAAARATFPVPHWSPTYAYATGPKWSQGDFWSSPTATRPVAGFRHSLTYTFPAGHLVRLRALGVTFGEETPAGIT